MFYLIVAMGINVGDYLDFKDEYSDQAGFKSPVLNIFIRVIWGDGLEVPLVLGHVLLDLEFQIVDEGLVLSVHHAVGDRETEETSSDEGEAQQEEDLSLTVRYHG